MRTIIAGGREITDSALVEKAIALSGFEITEVVCGMARGVDLLGYEWALRNKVAFTTYTPEWRKHGKRAGHLRNAEMARNADALILVWDGESRGSANMKVEAAKRGLRKFELLVNDQYPEGRGYDE